MRGFNDLFTRAELAERLGIKCDGRELNQYFTHLRSEHGLKMHTRGDTIVHYLGETRRVLWAHWDECGADQITLDVSTMIPDHIPTVEELTVEAEAAGLMSEADIIKFARPRMIKVQGTTSKPACLKALLDLNLQPERVFGDDGCKRYYNRSEVTEVIERWALFNKHGNHRGRQSRTP